MAIEQRQVEASAEAHAIAARYVDEMLDRLADRDGYRPAMWARGELYAVLESAIYEEITDPTP